MALANIVFANVLIDVPGPAPNPLDIQILGVTLTAPQDALWGSALIREVTRDTWQDVLAAVGIVDGEPIYEYVQLTFSGSVFPRLLLMGKTATPVAQVVNFDLGDAGAATDGLYRIDINGEAFDVTAVTQTRAQIVTSLLGLLPGAQPVTDAPGADTEQIDVTAAAAGTPFTFAATAPDGEAWIVTVSTPNVGITTDLVAWNAERDDFYLGTRVEPFGYDLANALRQALDSFPREIVFWARTDETTDPDGATNLATRVAARLALFGESRLYMPHVPTLTALDWGKHIAERLVQVPGSRSWTPAQLSGIVGVKWNSGQGANLIAGPYVFYDQIGTLGGAIAQNARSTGGLPFDTRRGADFLLASVRASVLQALLDGPPPYTPPGFGTIGAAINVPLQAAVESGFLVGTLEDGSPGFTVFIPTVESQTDPDRGARVAKGFGFVAQVQGAIEIVDPLLGTLVI